MEKKFQGTGMQLTGFHLKLIAMAAMVVDHGAYIMVPGNTWIYWMMRMIGRLAFPLYCFLLTEGFLYTRSKGKYLLRLGIFAFVTEPFFDFALHGAWIETGYQNVLFTFFVGFLMLLGVEHFKKKDFRPGQMGVFLSACLAAFFLKSDYDILGIVMIYIFYEYRSQFKMKALLSTGVMLMFSGILQAFGGFAFLPIGIYSGKPGRKTMKYFFYLFYPAHLMILYLVKQFIFNT